MLLLPLLCAGGGPGRAGERRQRRRRRQCSGVAAARQRCRPFASWYTNASIAGRAARERQPAARRTSTQSSRCCRRQRVPPMLLQTAGRALPRRTALSSSVAEAGLQGRLLDPTGLCRQASTARGVIKAMPPDAAAGREATPRHRAMAQRPSASSSPPSAGYPDVAAGPERCQRSIDVS